MNRRQTNLTRPLWALLMLSAAMGASPSLAASKSGSSDSQARYRRDVAACQMAPQGTDKAACLREAGAVRASREPVSVNLDPGRFARNALKRCEPLSEPDRNDCVARIQGKGTTSGSVAGGGIYREVATREVALPVAPSAAGTAASAAQ
jgi:hypothetical protein